MKKENAKDGLLLFEGTILSYAVHANNARSGIFVETFEVFKQFLSRDANMLVMCDVLLYFSMRKTLQEYFVDSGIDVMYYVRWEQSLGGNSPLEIKLRHIAKCIIFAILQPVMSAINSLNGKSRKMRNAKAFFSTGYVPPKKVRTNEKIKKFICMHDIIPILYREYFPQMDDVYYWYNIFIAQLDSKDIYFSNSQCTKNDFIRVFPKLSPEQIIVAYLGKNDRYRHVEKADAEIMKKYGIHEGEKYFFSLCTVEPRKNLIRSVKSFLQFIKREDITDLYYVIGGGKWKNFYGQMISEMQQDALFERYVKMIGYVDDESLPHLYSQAMCFVFTSQYEGFGLPALEAMSCGCPVITSTSSSLPEVVGDAGLTVAWDSEEEHIEAYHRIYTDGNLRRKLHESSLERAKLFSWEKCAEIMLREILNGK